MAELRWKKPLFLGVVTPSISALGPTKSTLANEKDSPKVWIATLAKINMFYFQVPQLVLVVYFTSPNQENSPQPRWYLEQKNHNRKRTAERNLQGLVLWVDFFSFSVLEHVQVSRVGFRLCIYIYIICYMFK